MKKLSLFVFPLTIFLIGFISCKSSVEKSLNTNSKSSSLLFEGIWTRSFDLGEGQIQQVFYRVWTDSIQYEMIGPLALNYMMKLDSFIPKDNRWIGNLNDVPYVIFVKNITTDSITLFKTEVKNKQEGMTMSVPSDTTSSHFSSWNVYHRKK